MELRLSITKGGRVSVLLEFYTSQNELNNLCPVCCGFISELVEDMNFLASEILMVI
jgi:hypothetical protein